ncbi:hypothetical protein [Nonomuraea sp. NPDC049607]|uniref:hypothetical protein n=1 Tax=Nonomuraea sp. NPDC049607 TaxID=3154732 RepID=UPI0034354FFD
MTSFLAGLGGKLAERWLARLALPGFLYGVFLVIAFRLRQEHAVDWNHLAHASADLLDELARTRPGILAAEAAGVLLGAALAGVLAQGLARLLLSLWFNPRWKRLAAHSAIGARMRSAEQRVSDFYALDLTLFWPRLWLVLSAQVRGGLRDAASALDSAVLTSAWGLAYLLVGIVWWPAAVGGAVVYATGWFLARERTANLAALVEAAVDIGLRPVARSLGIAPSSAATPAELGILLAPYLHKVRPPSPRSRPAAPSAPPVRSRRE